MNRHFAYLFCLAIAAGAAHAADDVATEAREPDVVDCGSPFLGDAEQEECDAVLSAESEALAGAPGAADMRILPVLPIPGRTVPWLPFPRRPNPRRPKPRPFPFPLPAKYRYLCTARSTAVEPHLRGRITGHVGKPGTSLAAAKQSALAACRIAHDRCEISMCYRAKP